MTHYFYQQMAKLRNNVVLVITLTLFLLLVIRAWPTTWDDSGITLAFSRNLARYGDIVPTALSARAEGYSSFFWMILNALFFRIGFNENTVLFIAKILATLFAVLNIYLFWKLIRANINTPLYRIMALGLLSINSYTIASAVDGMETSLYAFLVLISYLLFKKRASGKTAYILFSILASLLILIRHEGTLFLIPFVLVTWMEKGKSITRQPFLYFWAIVFFTYHAWHYTFFGELLTNPMLAKRFWPYRPEIDSVATFAIFYLSPLFDLIFRYLGLFLLLPTYLILNKKYARLDPEKENWNCVLFIVLISIFIMLITGANWGAAARISYPGLPFLLLFLFSKIDDSQRFPRQKFLQAFTIMALFLNAIVIYNSVSALTPDIISLNGVERRASSISTLQIAIHRPIITFAGVDMGGLLLYHGDGKKIIDLGLLCDRVLAKTGYAQLDAYLFEQMKPEIIEAHGFWLFPLNEIPSFKMMYEPIMVLTERNEQILYLRKDIAKELKTIYPMPFATARSGFKDIDQPTLEQLGKFLVLDLKTKQ